VRVIGITSASRQRQLEAGGQRDAVTMGPMRTLAVFALLLGGGWWGVCGPVLFFFFVGGGGGGVCRRLFFWVWGKEVWVLLWGGVFFLCGGWPVGFFGLVGGGEGLLGVFWGVGGGIGFLFLGCGGGWWVFGVFGFGG